MFVVFALAERKNDKREKRKYHSAEGLERQLRKSNSCLFFARRAKNKQQKKEKYR
jgi:hypothetical protein